MRFARCDGFEVYSSLVGRLSPLGRRDDGRLVLRNPLNGLDALKPAAGLVATVSVLLGSTAYDGFSSTRIWVQAITTSSIPPETLGALGLVGFITAAYATYSTATSLAGTLGGISERGLPGKFVHSIIPIAAGYVIAHYFSFFVFEGQNALILAADPFNTTGRTSSAPPTGRSTTPSCPPARSPSSRWSPSWPATSSQ
jgi:hypothetical protein